MSFKAWFRQSFYYYLPSLLVTVIFLGLFFYYVDPAPPRHFAISTGQDEDNYYTYAKEYADIMKPEGVVLEVRTSKGAWENLYRLGDKNSGVSAGFVQDGIGERKKFPDIQSLGSIGYLPLWIFYRKKSPQDKTEITRLGKLLGKKILVGERGGETHTMARKLLKSYGVNKDNATFIEMPMEEESQAFLEGKAEYAFFMSPPTNPIIQKLLNDQGLKLVSLDQAEGITRQFTYLHHLVLPHGAIDLEKNIPEKDIDMIAPTSTLLVRKDIHPALVYLLLKAAERVHRKADIFEKRHEFPTDKDVGFPLHANAKNFYQAGTPFWLRYLPFWLATIVQRFIFLVIPLAALIIPIVRAVPRFLQWRARSKIYQRYGELKFLEGKIKADASAESLKQYLEQLDSIEDRVNTMKIPLEFTDYAYSLRGHIQFVRDRLKFLAR